MSNWETELEEYVKDIFTKLDKVKWGTIQIHVKNGVAWRIVEEKSIELARDEWKK